MGFVICAVHIDAIPARWEEDLGAKTTWAVITWEKVGFVLASSKTGEADGLACIIVAEATFAAISSQHTEIFWESLECAWTTLEIVDCLTSIEIAEAISNGRNRLESSVGILEVEFGSPVVGVILFDGARAALRGSGFVVAHVESESIATHDLMGMGSNSTGIYNRIGPLFDEVVGAAESDKGRCRSCDKGGKADSDNFREHRVVIL